ncbi:hypothetical protein HDU97_009403 [Phlyctochytrium planicorne]|nr:hypothetical protein HDU97_009403 [Phlyctochytrium planicorne]
MSVLPTEVLSNIIADDTDARTLFNASLVCKDWNQVFSAHLLRHATIPWRIHPDPPSYPVFELTHLFDPTEASASIQQSIIHSRKLQIEKLTSLSNHIRTLELFGMWGHGDVATAFAMLTKKETEEGGEGGSGRGEGGAEQEQRRGLRNLKRLIFKSCRIDHQASQTLRQSLESKGFMHGVTQLEFWDCFLHPFAATALSSLCYQNLTEIFESRPILHHQKLLSSNPHITSISIFPHRIENARMTKRTEGLYIHQNQIQSPSMEWCQELGAILSSIMLSNLSLTLKTLHLHAKTLDIPSLSSFLSTCQTLRELAILDYTETVSVSTLDPPQSSLRVLKLCPMPLSGLSTSLNIQLHVFPKTLQYLHIPSYPVEPPQTFANLRALICLHLSISSDQFSKLVSTSPSLELLVTHSAISGTNLSLAKGWKRLGRISVCGKVTEGDDVAFGLEDVVDFVETGANSNCRVEILRNDGAPADSEAVWRVELDLLFEKYPDRVFDKEIHLWHPLHERNWIKFHP